MPKIVKPLSDADCRHLRYGAQSAKGNRLRDGQGLYLEALPTGRKVWRLEYRTAKGTKSRATLEHDYGTKGGTLTKARQWREDVRELLAQGIDPNQHAQQEQARKRASQLSTFDAAADEWLEHKRPTWSPRQYEKVEGVLRRVLRPWLGKRPVREIAPAEVLHALQQFEKVGKVESAHRGREYASSIFRRAILHGLTNSDPAAALRGALRPKNSKNYAHMTDPGEIGGLLRAIEGYTGNFSVAYALKLSPLFFVRPGELRQARWDEFDLEQGEWRIPAERMKSRRPHMVPLAQQAIATLKELQRLSKHAPDSLLFPSVRSSKRPITDSTLTAALRRLGYTQEQITPHGFRHMASTRLHEMGWDSHVIEAQLAHKDSNAIRAVYNKAEYWPERIKLMQAWADYLDSLKAGQSKVTPIRKGVA